MESCRKIVFANQKGGVGKTTTAVNLAAYLAAMGNNVLAIDIDPQGNLTSSFGIKADRATIYEVLVLSVDPHEAIYETKIENLHVMPSNINLTGANIELVSERAREYFLHRNVQKLENEYHYILIDCPPSLGLLTINGFAAATEIIIPLQCEYFALEGLARLLKTIKIIQKKINDRLDITGIVFTMYDSRTRLAHDVVRDVVTHFGKKVFRTIIPRNVRLSEAPSFGIPISLYDAECVGAQSYHKLCNEVVARANAR